MNKFYPEIYQESIYTINYKKLKENNIKCLLFDLDNTCIPYNNINIPEKLDNLFTDLKKMGFRVIIFSNSPERRLKKITPLNVEYNASSKKPFTYNLKKIIKQNNYKEEEVCIIGDQLLTDILGGNLVGIHTCLIEPITDIDMFITKLSRKIESNIFKKLEKEKKFNKGDYYD